jgi:hypothetical protein
MRQRIRNGQKALFFVSTIHKLNREEIHQKVTTKHDGMPHKDLGTSLHLRLRDCQAKQQEA